MIVLVGDEDGEDQPEIKLPKISGRIGPGHPDKIDDLRIGSEFSAGLAQRGSR